MTPVSNEVAMKLMDALERMVALYEGEFDIVGGRPDWLVEALNLRFSTLSPTVSQPVTGEEVEVVARAIAFAGRMEHDMSADAAEFWAHTGEDSRERYRTMAREALSKAKEGKE